MSASEHVSISTARRTQALGIAVADRLARSGTSGRVRVLGRVWRLQLDLAGMVIGEPAEIVDRTYEHVQRLNALHREFAQRLFEAIDTRELTVRAPAAGGRVASAQGAFERLGPPRSIWLRLSRGPGWSMAARRRTDGSASG